MKQINKKIIGLWTVIILSVFSIGVYAEDSQKEPVMNKDQVEGRIDEAKGKIKEATGIIFDDHEMEVEGNVQKNIGKIQSKIGDLKEDVKDSI